MRKFLLFLCVLLAGNLTANAQIADKDLPSYLMDVTARGRALYAYDQAAWHGTDAFVALHPNTEGLTHYICTRGTEGWVVTFPKWNALHDHLQIAYEARETGKPDVYTARKFEPAIEAPDSLIAMERALELAMASFQRERRPYNSAILPAPGGNFYVYIYPAQVKDTVWPLGGDVRYTISSDGKTILETRQLHRAIMDIEFKPEMNPAAGYHVHILSDLVEDTDVLYVLNRRPLIPEQIEIAQNKKRRYVIMTDGNIVLVKK